MRSVSSGGAGPAARPHLDLAAREAAREPAAQLALEAQQRAREAHLDVEVAVVHAPHLDLEGRALELELGAPEAGHAADHARASRARGGDGGGQPAADLARGRRRGADLAHHHRGRRRCRSPRPRAARRPRRRASVSAAIAVSPAPCTSNTSQRSIGTSTPAGSSLEDRHALGAPRHHHGAAAELAAQPRHGRGERRRGCGSGGRRAAPPRAGSASRDRRPGTTRDGPSGRRPPARRAAWKRRIARAHDGRASAVPLP